MYASGNSIIIRSVKNPLSIDVFSQHRVDTTVARFAPSGNYCASADCQGNILIWDTTNKVEHIVKYQKQSFGNGVTDIAWSDDSKRVLAVGDGKNAKGEVFGWDSGNSLGEISGHTGKLNACAFRQQRPYRVVTGGDDKMVNFYSGPPFKYTRSNREQQRFVNTIEYSPDGSIFVASGGDHNIYVYDGTEGTKKSQFSATDEHKMGIYSVTFSPDGKQLFSASADKTAKLWDVATGAVVATYSVGTDLSDTPVGSAWTAVGPAVVTLRGDIAFFDVAGANRSPVNVWRGHHKGITSINYYPSAAGDASNRAVNFVTTSADGQVLEYSATTGAYRGLPGFPHESKPSYAAVYSPVLQKVASLGSDDTLVVQNSTNNPAYAPGAAPAASGSSSAAQAAAAAAAAVPAGAVRVPVKQPKTLALLPCQKQVVVAALRALSIVDLTNGSVVSTLPTTYDIVSVATGVQGGVYKEGSVGIVVVGGGDQNVHLYKYTKALEEYGVVKGKYSGIVNAVAVSSNGELYAAARDRFLAIGKTSTGEIIDESRVLHTAKINAVDFSPDNTRLLSTGLDSFIYVWDLSDVEKWIKRQGVHAPQGVYVAKWADNKTFITGGGDYFVRTWKIE